MVVSGGEENPVRNIKQIVVIGLWSDLIFGLKLFRSLGSKPISGSIV